MSKRRRLIWATAAIILPLQAIALAASTQQSELSTALKELTSEGYKVEKAINCTLDQATEHEYLIALSDVVSDAIPARPVMILLVAVGKKQRSRIALSSITTPAQVSFGMGHQISSTE